MLTRSKKIIPDPIEFNLPNDPPPNDPPPDDIEEDDVDEYGNIKGLIEYSPDKKSRRKIKKKKARKSKINFSDLFTTRL